MKSLEKGKDKIQQICEILKKDTLEPAQQAAAEIIRDAEARAAEIISQAKSQAEALLEENRHRLHAERDVFHASLSQSAKQTVEALKQEIEQKLFNENIETLLAHESSAPQLVAKLIDAIINGIEKEGLSKDFAVLIPKMISAEDVAAVLSKETLKKLEQHPLSHGTFAGGAQVHLRDKKLTLTVTDREIAEFLKRYVRKDFRRFIFEHANG